MAGLYKTCTSLRQSKTQGGFTMKYPKWNNFCTIQKRGTEVEITHNILEEKFCLPTDMVRWGKQLDGKTNPFNIDPTINRATVRSWLKTLDEFDCIRRNRVLLKTTGTFLYSIYIPKKITVNMRVFSWFYNKALQLLFLPMLILGIYHFSTHPTYSSDGLYLGFILGLALGMLLHEISHACATLACPEGRFFEIGIGISYFIMPIAYALINEKCIKSRFQKIQINLAGIEFNLLFCGLSLLFAGLFPETFSGFFLGAAIQNGFLGLLNLVFSNGIDGGNTISLLLGDNTNGFISKSRGFVFSKKKRQKELNKGITGYAVVTAAYIFQLLQLTIPALYIWNILSVLGGVFE